MQRTRNNNRGVAYREYLADVAAEQAAEKAAADAAQAEADAKDPVKAFQKASDAEAQAIRDTILNHRISESLLPGERVNGRKINEDVAASNLKLWAQQESTFQRYMFETFYAALKRNDLAPIANNFGALHRLLLQYAAYPDEPVQVVAPAPVEEPQPVLTPSEKFMADQVNLDTVLAIVDGVEISERYLNSLPSREELKIRRKLEKGHAGDSNLDEYLERRDVKFAME